MQVKICGITTQAAYEASAGADWVGFVFFDRSPRYLTPARAARLAQPGGPAKVGLFVNPTDDDLSRALDSLPLDAVQLYVSATRLEDIASRFPVPVWHAVGVSCAADLPLAAGPAAAFVIEPKPPAGASRPGGLAQRLDWRVVAGWSACRPWLLAGGLTPGNVGQAIRQSGAGAVDVSSGVERAVGVKDPELIAAFVRAAHGARRDGGARQGGPAARSQAPPAAGSATDCNERALRMDRPGNLL